MDIVEAKFKINSAKNRVEQLDIIYSLLGAYRMNGQILGQGFSVFQQNREYVVHLRLPDTDSLEKKYNNKYVDLSIGKLSDVSLEKPLITRLGEDTESIHTCQCDAARSYILYTSYLSLESPLRCLDCFGTIPLCQIPKTNHEEYYDIICWTSDYQSCDRLQMNCTVGEKFATNQMSKLDSALTQQGLEICRRISKLTNKNTYYYLYKGISRSRKSKKARLCPSCREEWLLKIDLHQIFDFKCDKCLLLSNISWDVR